MKLRKRMLKEILETVKLLLITLVLTLFIKENVIASGYVPSGSMEDTVMTESRILINQLAYIGEDPQRGDIVAFHYPDDPEQIYLKRVMGLPGETIAGYGGIVYINETPLLDDFTDQKLEQDFGPFQIPEGCYFMMGDNRNNSWDSRYWNHKYVEIEKIIGKVDLVFYPELKRLK